MKTKIQIKSVVGKLLFEFEKEDNSIKQTLQEAIRNGANLQGADLRGADLYGADLYGANLYGAGLRSANLYGADLRSADLYGADLRDADLRSANLRSANLRSANLYGADLRSANLYGADLYGADLRGAKSLHYQIIPSEGSFIAWKKCRRNLVLKLEIPTEAKRTSAISDRKCRAEYAKVLQIFDKEGNERDIAFGLYNGTEYKKGEIVRADSFDDDPRVVCSNGIHFFITRQEAEEYES